MSRTRFEGGEEVCNILEDREGEGVIGEEVTGNAEVALTYAADAVDVFDKRCFVVESGWVMADVDAEVFGITNDMDVVGTIGKVGEVEVAARAGIPLITPMESGCLSHLRD